ncbi:hypothetical protein [Mycobacterium sp. AZCC_0083]|uniref:hypothetical protein n=1 Tax=Mycobacterium sp. AZCC_0083 TaxID=2735882 RepID=UPI0016147C21|nr:hypothetical protein [Mycobacterium sp. AZCC_0083]MBB5167106.1 hypothetical protein [Mycobacterium sp. AZCC_0083]
MSKAKTMDVPFDLDGNMISYPMIGWEKYVDYSGNERQRRVFTGIAPMEPFSGTLRIIGHERGQSAARFNLRDDETGTEYVMFMKDVVDMLVAQEISFTATWTPVKRGQNYGLAMVTE